VLERRPNDTEADPIIRREPFPCPWVERLDRAIRGPPSERKKAKRGRPGRWTSLRADGREVDPGRPGLPDGT